MIAYPHPTDFYIVHAYFLGFPSPWGSLSDGPIDDLWDAVDAIKQHFVTAPLLSQVKVWHFQPDVAPRDVTEDVLAGIEWPESEEGTFNGDWYDANKGEAA